MSGHGRYANAIPAGAEDDESDDDIWCSSRPVIQSQAQPPNSFASQNNDPYSDICTVPNGNQRIGCVAAKANDKPARESAVEEFRMTVAAHRTDAAMAMLAHLNPNAVSRSGWSPLMFAIESGEVEICKKLLEMGANPNHHIENFSVLMAASRCRRVEHAAELIKLLVEEHGVTATDAKDRYHSTPLMYAAMEGNADVIKYLLEHCKVLVDSYDARGHTALMLAVRRGHLEASQVLLDTGADREKMNVDGKTAKEMSMDSGNVAIINLLNDKSIHVSALDSFNEVSRYGEMESFFYGLQLHELIDVFKEQNVQFKQLLLLSENDLLYMGVKMGDVKKISEAVHAIHKKPWNQSSLHKFDPKTRNVLKCSEAVAIVENISKHASLMCSSIGYVADQVKCHQAVIDSGIDNGAALKLHTCMCEATANSQALLQQLDRLRGIFLGKDAAKDSIPVDKIDPQRKSPGKKRGKRLWLRLFLGLGVGTCIVVGLAMGAKSVS